MDQQVWRMRQFNELTSRETWNKMKGFLNATSLMLILTVSQQLVGVDARTCGVELFDVGGKESLDVALSWGLVDMGGKGGRLQPLFTCTSRPQWPVEVNHYFARFVKHILGLLLADMKYIFKSETKIQTLSLASLSVTVITSNVYW